jgi:phage terminase Nu1 subunit (DNA packaging protein)
MAKDSTQEQFAQLVGISQPAVAQLIRKGVLNRKGDIVQWTKEYTRNLREQAAGRASENGGHDLVAERARLSARQAEKLEIELAKSRGELLPTESIVEALTFTAATIRTKLLSVPSRYKSLSPRLSAKEIDVLDNLIREILTELSNVHFPKTIGESARRYFSNLHIAAETEGERVGGSVSLPESGSERRTPKVEDEAGAVS